MAVQPSSTAGTTVPTPRAADRIGGADRIDTAIDASRWSSAKTGTGGRQASVAVISRSDEFADALGGSALAAQKGGPLLLTTTNGLDPRVRDELKQGAGAQGEGLRARRAARR